MMDSLKHTKAEGQRILFVGLERRSKNSDIMQLNLEKTRLLQNFSKDFKDIVICEHEFDANSEIRGACSNIFHVQNCAIQYAHDQQIDCKNVIFYKFDGNNKLVIYNNKSEVVAHSDSYVLELSQNIQTILQ